MVDPNDESQDKDAPDQGPDSRPEEGKHSPDQAQVGTTDGDGDNG